MTDYQVHSYAENYVRSELEQCKKYVIQLQQENAALRDALHRDSDVFQWLDEHHNGLVLAARVAIKLEKANEN